MREGGSVSAYPCSQKRHIGLLKYQAMPSLRDVAYDGWLCTFTILYSYITAAGNSISSCQGNRYGTEKAGRYGLSIKYKITPAGKLSSSHSQAGRRVGPAL